MRRKAGEVPADARKRDHAAAGDVDLVMNSCRQEFLEAKANSASLRTPAQVNRFVAEAVGPMRVMPDGTVQPKSDTADRAEVAMSAVSIEDG